MKDLILVRGPSGYGKTTLAEAITRDYCNQGIWCSRFSADDFFTRANGDYEFDSFRLSDAHAGCKFRVESAMRDSMRVIVVDNTFTQYWEWEPYIRLAEDYAYRVIVYRCESFVDLNNHDVPDAARQSQARRMEDFWG
jgi:hypothetical protein